MIGYHHGSIMNTAVDHPSIYQVGWLLIGNLGAFTNFHLRPVNNVE